MKLQFTEDDYRAVTARMDEATQRMRCAQSLADAEAALEIYHQAYIKVASAFSRMSMAVYQDVSDQEAMSLYVSNVQRMCDTMYYMPFHQAMAQSPYYQKLYDACGAPFMELMRYNLKCETDKAGRDDAPPSTEELVARYQTLAVQADGKYEQYAQEFDDLLQELVEINHRTAKYHGYETYCEMGNRINLRFDYGEQEIMSLCAQVCRLVVPYYQEFRRRYNETLSKEGPKARDLETGMAAYTQHLGGDAQAYWSLLLEKGYLDLACSPTKMPGIGIQRIVEEEGAGPIIMNDEHSFNAGWILAHEFGHSLQGHLSLRKQRYAFNIIGSTDQMEIASRTMEMFLYVHASDLYENAQDYVVFHINSMLISLISFAMSAQYEHWLYHHVEATKQQRREKYRELYCAAYPWKEQDETSILRDLYNEVTIFTMPKYQFCYVPAWLNAAEMIRDYLNDPETTYRRYLDLIADIPVRRYQELIDAYGLHNVFDEGAVERFIGCIDDILTWNSRR